MTEKTTDQRLIIERILKGWEANSGLRFGQFIYAITEGKDFFYFTDEELAKRAEGALKNE